MQKDKLLICENVKKHYPVRGSFFFRSVGVVRAVDGVDFYVKRGETFSLIGESGCGKTTIGLTILRLIEPTAGKVYFQGENIFELGKREMIRFRRNMQIVFQDPQSSLNPRMTVKSIISEPLVIHNVHKGNEVERVLEILESVGLRAEHMEKYPHELSGGQKQRVGLARALTLEPKLIVLDEPTSSVDVSVQAKILNLLKKLRENMGLSYLFITHDLSVIKHVSNRTAVMYLGKIVESATTEELFRTPQHPYTQALLSAIPNPNPRTRHLDKVIVIKGEVPSPMNPPLGCRFHTRCPFVKPKCKNVEPEPIETRVEHYVSCHYPL